MKHSLSSDRQSTPQFSRLGQKNGEASRSRVGVFLINLGTPDAPETGPTRRYLKQFLSDPRVIDMSALGRYLLLRLFILPFRPKKSAAAYRTIWTDEGSPILVHGRQLMEAVQVQLNTASDGRYDVRLGMRYGNPSIRSVLESFQADGIDDLLILPLYPQYASATVGSTIEEVYRVANEMWNVPTIQTLPAFYNNPRFIEAWRQMANESISLDQFDHVLFSFHGLPERHVKKSDPTGGHCLSSTHCCDQIVQANRFCYRAHCLHTARAIAAGLNLPDGKWTMTFQSRLGRDPWLRPYTDYVIKELPAQGIKRLAIFSPAFVADCLETLEELTIRANEDFRQAGGETCVMVPSLNCHPAWVETVVSIVLAAKLALRYPEDRNG